MRLIKICRRDALYIENKAFISRMATHQISIAFLSRNPAGSMFGEMSSRQDELYIRNWTLAQP